MDKGKDRLMKEQMDEGEDGWMKERMDGLYGREKGQCR